MGKLDTKKFYSFNYLLVSYIWEIIVLQLILIRVLCERIFRLIFPKQPKSLRNQTVLITGGGNGIGKAIALKLGPLANVIISWDVETKANNDTIAQLRSKGCKAFGYTVDISDPTAIQKAAEKIKKEFGNVHMIINNAGIVPNAPFDRVTSLIEEKAFKVNVLSHFEIFRQFLPAMIENDEGHIVTIASIASVFAAKELAAYVATKHAIVGYLESLRQEIEDKKCTGIKFTTVYPCFVKTRVMDGVKLEPRFSWNFPTVTPEYVAQKTVDAIRRDVEDLYIPQHASLLPLLRCFIPSEAKRHLQNGVFKINVTRPQETNNN